VKIDQIVILIIVAWLFALTASIFWLRSFFNRLTGGKKEIDLKKSLENIFVTQKANEKSIGDLTKEIKDLKVKNFSNVQKIGLVKFNPFDETGGDHSFSLVMLDGTDTGVIITSLHTRERTRTYTKDIVKGKSKLGLSKEEENALKVALKK